MRIAALLLVVVACSGCTVEPADRFAPDSEERATPETDTYPGLVLRGHLEVEADHAAVTAFLDNRGNRTYQVETGCGSPWAEVLFRGGDQLEVREPVARCQGFALTELPPGMSLTNSYTWDGTLWDDGRLRDAPAGDYTWSIRAVAYQEGGAGLKRFDLDFPVRLL